MCYYDIRNDAQKAQKYKQKIITRYENICDSKHELKKALLSYAEFRKLIPQGKAWVESSKFKEKYANHPYPPLLNPSSIDYESISAEVAWELNLPLPPYYDLIYFSNGSQASATTMQFFKECGVGIKDFYYSPKNIYCGYYCFLLGQELKNKNCIFFYAAFMADILFKLKSDSHKLLYLLNQQISFIYIARDPISLIKGYLNHLSSDGYIVANLSKSFNMTCSYNQILHYPIYVNNKNTPSFEVFKNEGVLLDIMARCFVFSSIIKILQDKISKVHCIEFNDLKPELGFDTFCKLADKLGIDRPKNDNFIKAKLGAIARGTLTALPATLYVHQSDMQNVFKDGLQENQNLDSLKTKDGFSIIITLPYVFGNELPDYLKEGQKDFTNITDEIQKNLIIDDTPIWIFIKQIDLVELKKINGLWNVTKEYLKGYINALQNHAIKIRANLITEEQVLQYFRINYGARKYAKQLLDNEIYYIKEHYPDFIKKWKYYLEFEKMCAELDSAESTNNLNSTSKKEELN